MNLSNKKNYHKYFGFLKVALFQILFLLMCSVESYAGGGESSSFGFWEDFHVFRIIFGIIFFICVTTFLIFNIIFQFFVYIVRDKLKIGLWYVIVPILVLPFVYSVARIVDDTASFVCGVVIMTPIMAFIIALSKYLKRKLRVISFVSKQKKVNPKVIVWVLDVFLIFVSSVIIGSILCVLWVLLFSLAQFFKLF